MRTLSIYFGLFFFLFFFLACDNELEPFEPKKDIPVLYGILQQDDTAQYVRVERALLSEDRAAVDIAKEADSLYYDNATVTLIQESNGQAFPMVRVNGTDEGFVRVEGAFVTDPNYLYKLKFPQGQSLQIGETYSVTVDRNNGEPVAKATTAIIEETTFSQPPTEEISMSSVSNRRIAWRLIPNAIFYELYIIFLYEEETFAGSGVYEVKQFRELIRNSQEINNEIKQGSSSVTVLYDGLTFYEALGEALEEGPDRRLLAEQYLGFEVLAVGDEVGDYFELLQANVGLTSAEVLPSFTNVENGLGILTSASSTVNTTYKLRNSAIEELRTNDATRTLGF